METKQIPATLELVLVLSAADSRNGRDHHNVRCRSCMAFEGLEKSGENTILRHTRRCGTPDAQISRGTPDAPLPVRSDATRRAEMEFADHSWAIRGGATAMSRAMNRDD